jgi:phosphoribosyl 1,2-cyclic phosphodiesterase
MEDRINTNWIKFLGTAGARFVMIKQLRASGGIWVSFEGTQIIIDPGPGSLVRCASSRPRLDPGKLDAIIITHRHLDHSNDINVMIEAMTEGGFKKRGVVLLPKDAIESDSIILPHTRLMPEKIITLEGRRQYTIGSISITTSQKLIHPVETYGLNVYNQDKGFSLISDTAYFEGLEENFKKDCLIINTVFLKPRAGIEHLSREDAERIIKIIKPRLTILTHFGMTMLKAKPYKLAEELKNKLKINVLAARDGQRVEIGYS